MITSRRQKPLDVFKQFKQGKIPLFLLKIDHVSEVLSKEDVYKTMLPYYTLSTTTTI